MNPLNFHSLGITYVGVRTKHIAEMRKPMMMVIS
jgi:hypothetical protein